MLIYQAEFGFAPVVETYRATRHSLETAIRLDPIRHGGMHGSAGFTRPMTGLAGRGRRDEKALLSRVTPLC